MFIGRSQIVLDVDATDDPLHGQQDGSSTGITGHLPLTCGAGRPNIDAAGRQRQAWRGPARKPLVRRAAITSSAGRSRNGAAQAQSRCVSAELAGSAGWSARPHLPAANPRFVALRPDTLARRRV